MCRIGLTYADVVDAYDAIVEAGTEPSIRAISAHLGDKGRLKTIALHVRTLKAERWEGSEPALPDPLLRALIAGAETYWSQLAEAADAQVESSYQHCDAQIETMRAELDASNTQLDIVRAERDDAYASQSSLREELSAEKARVAALVTQLAESDDRLQTSLQNLEASNHQLEQTRAALKNLDSVRLNTADEHDGAQRLITERLETINSLKAQLQNQEQEHRTALQARDQTDEKKSEELDTVRISLAAATQSLDRWEARQSQWKQDRESLTKRLKILQSASVLQQNQKSEWQRALNTLQAENSAIKSQLDKARTMAIEAERQQATMLDALSAEFTTLVDEVELIENDIVSQS